MTGRLERVDPCMLIEHVRAQGYGVFAPTGMGVLEWRETAQELMSAVAHLIRVFPAPDLWRPISVRTEKHPNRSEGVGESPLHIDFVNAYNPPDYVCLLCVRDDPLGGGATVLAPTDVWHTLADDQVELLRQAIFSDGQVVGLANVGDDVNPFRVIDDRAYWSFRYSGKLVAADPDPATVEALECVTRALQQARLTVVLEPGDAIVLDQHRWVHGKTALGDGQEKLDSANRRLLLQSFYRDHANPLL